MPLPILLLAALPMQGPIRGGGRSGACGAERRYQEGEQASDGDTGEYSGSSSEEVDAPVPVARKKFTCTGERQRPASETVEEEAIWRLMIHRELQQRVKGGSEALPGHPHRKLEKYGVGPGDSGGAVATAALGLPVLLRQWNEITTPAGKMVAARRKRCTGTGRWSLRGVGATGVAFKAVALKAPTHDRTTKSG